MLKEKIDFIEEFIKERQEYPESCAQVIKALPKSVSAKELDKLSSTRRRDLRALKTFTIDGITAKDLDDAVSIMKDADGLIHLYVHIADVSHYVKANGKLDKEALNRGNTYYLIDKVLPMLPFALSNRLCSLREHEPKLCLTVELIYKEDGIFVRGDIYESIISSDLRADYDSIYRYFSEAEDFLQADDPFFANENKQPEQTEADNFVQNRNTEIQHESLQCPERYLLIRDEVMLAKKLAHSLRMQRIAAGSVMFDLPELEFTLNDEGEPVSAGYCNITWANRLIEEFMIAANEFVAAYAEVHSLPIVYRVHGEPDQERLEAFLKLAKELNLKIPQAFYHKKCKITPKQISALLSLNKRHEAYETIEALLLRSMAKAIYSPAPDGHFGLALEDYCHFTSPIRRYSDLITHRVLKNHLHGLHQGRIAKRLNDICNHISEQERLAIGMERDVKSMMSARYLHKLVGNDFTARISGFVEKGLFLALENGIEGFMPFNCLSDHFVFIPERMMAKGLRYGKNLHLGEKLEVQLVKVNLESFLIDFVAVDPTLGMKGGRKRVAKVKNKRVGAQPSLLKSAKKSRLPSKSVNSKQTRSDLRRRKQVAVHKVDYQRSEIATYAGIEDVAVPELKKFDKKFKSRKHSDKTCGKRRKKQVARRKGKFRR